MRVLIAALASLGVNVAFWLHYRGIDALDLQLRARDAQKDAGLLLLSAWLVLEGLLLVVRSFRRSSIDGRSFDGIDAAEIDALYQQRELYQAEIQKSREELTYTTRRLLAIAAERDAMRAQLEGGAPMPHQEAPPPSAVPLSRGARL